jgi:hypothetical protein
VLTAEFGMAHAFGVILIVSGLDTDLPGQLDARRIERTERGHQVFDLPFVQHVLVNHHRASVFGFLVGVQSRCRLPQGLAGVKEIDKLNRTREMSVGNVPDPCGPIADDGLPFRAAPTELPGFRLETLARLFGRFDGTGAGGGFGSRIS